MILSFDRISLKKIPRFHENTLATLHEPCHERFPMSSDAEAFLLPKFVLSCSA